LEAKRLSWARFGIITVSDTRTADSDESGPAIREALSEIGASSFEYSIVKDQVEAIRDSILELAKKCDAIFTTGGTGFAPTDVTPEATASLLDRRASGVEHLLHTRSLEKTPFAPLSRGIAGTIGRTLIVNLSGSPKGAADGVRALATLLPHLLDQVSGRGGAHE
jgi:molybdenum cofactor synthesis domain-containing protein